MYFPRLELCLVLLFAASTAHAQMLIQFDFNNASGEYSGIQSPGHADGTFGASTNWNIITGETTSGLVYANGSAATGVSIDVGQSLNSTSAIDWDDTPALGTDPGAGVFATVLGSDNFYVGDNRKLGARVSGLAPGTYNMYAIGRGVATGQLSFTYNQSIGLNLSDLSDPPDLLGAVSNVNSWIEGETYLLGQVTTTSTNDFITFITQANSGTPFAAMQGLQIAEVTAVPEPSTYAACFGAVALGFAAWRRRKQTGRSTA